MAKKLTAYAHDGSTMLLTPNQFQTWKMRQRLSMMRCGHFSLGYSGPIYRPEGPDDREVERGKCKVMWVMREYDDLGSQWDEPMHGYDPREWKICPEGRLSHIRMVLEHGGKVLRWLDDLGGKHPMDTELRADIKAEREALLPILNAG